MERQEKFGAAHAALLALTLLFLAALYWEAGRERAVLARDSWSVETERSVPEEALERESRPLDVNAATAEELQELMGIGPALAQAIVDYRAEHGPFASVDELLEVSGIGEGKLDAIRDGVTIGGGAK